jgi:2-hydroxycyclohexanecarboxyl-CoA dehydrogenase
MMPAWSGPRTAIVTGGASGIGLGISQRLAAEGAAVAIWDLNGDAADAAAKEIEAAGGKAIGQAVDVSDRDRIDAAVEEVRGELGAATILVNNAGLSGNDKFLDISRETLQRIIAVNLIGTFDCCQAVVPDMIAAGWGRIVNISSSSAQTGSARMTHYSASKGGVFALTKSLALELGPKGITVNNLPPGSVDTPMMRDAESKGYFGGPADNIAKMVPVRRLGTPADMAAACAFVVRDESGYINGQVIGVNGGRVPN